MTTKFKTKSCTCRSKWKVEKCTDTDMFCNWKIVNGGNSVHSFYSKEDAQRVADTWNEQDAQKIQKPVIQWNQDGSMKNV